MQNDYPLAPDKIEIKEKMPSSYQLKIADLYSIPIDNVKRFVPDFFDKVSHYEKVQLYLRVRLKREKKTHRVLELSQS